MKAFLIKASEILKAAVTKFSMINMAQYITMATIIVGTWTTSNLLTVSESLIITGVITLIYKYWESSKELVQTGFNLNWTIYLSGLFSVTIGILDTFVADGNFINHLLGSNAKIIIMIYLALTVIFRTGFTNQQKPE